ncbi:hypothetical protein EBT23_04600, partial [bacterium]|nr:hypothetical protein [bacterium]
MSDADLRRHSRYTWMLIAFSAVAIFFMAHQSRADINWDGDNAAGNFSYANNWYGNTVPSASFSAGNLVFNYNNGGSTSIYYDWASWANINDIIWETTWSGNTTFNGNGNGLNFNQRLENRSSATITIGSMNLSGGKNGASQIELSPVGGDMVLNGNIYNDNNLNYKTYGGNSKLLTVNTTLNGSSSVGYAIEQYSKVYFTAAQKIGGSSTFDVKAGELWIGTGGSLTNGMRINLGLNDSATAKFYLTGTASDSHAITVLNNGGVKVVGTLGTGGTTNTFSGNITNNSTSGGVLLENTADGVANFTGVISGTGSVQVGGSSTTGTVILAGNNTFSGPLTLSAGTLSITNANSLGTGQINIGNAGILNTLLVNSNTAITNTFQVYNASTNGVINVASGTTTTISGKLTQDSAKTNSTKFGKDGAGTLILNATNSDYNGQLQIGQGTVILGANNALGTNSSTGARGIDLGLNVGDFSTTNNVSLLASNGVTVGQSIYVANNTNANTATRTIGLSGNGTNTFNNQFYLDGTLTVNVGTATNDRVNLTGNITNSGSLIKTGSGFLSLSASNSYTGGTAIALGSTEGIIIGHDNAFGTGTVTNLAVGGTFQSDTTRTVANNFILDKNTFFTGSGSLTINGTLSISASPDLTNNLTGGLTLGNLTLGNNGTSRTLNIRGTGNTAINGIIANASSQTTNNLSIGGSGITSLNGNNTYTGATTIQAGAIAKLGHANGLGSTSSGTTISSGGALDLNGQTGVAEAITGGGSGVSSSGLLFNSSASAASLSGAVALSANTTIAVTNGAMTISGAISDSGGVRGLTKTGTGTLTLSGANSYSGGVTFSAGTLVVGNDAALGTGAADFADNNLTLNTDNSARTITNAITFRNLTIGGTGALTLSGTITNTASSNTLTNNNSGGLTIGGLMLSGTATGRTVTIAGTGNTTITGTIANGPSATTGGLTINSSGTTTLSGSNSYSGNTTITSGTVILSGTNTGSGSVILSASTSVFKIGRTDSLANGNLSGASSTGNTGLVDLTSGGNYSINSLGNSSAVGGYMNFTNSSGLATTLTFTNATNYITASSGNSGGRTISNNSTNLTIVFNGAVDIGSSANADVQFGGPGSFTVNGAIFNTNTGVRGFTKNGAGTVTLVSDNTYNGATTVSGGGVLVLLGSNTFNGLNISSGSVKIGKSSSLGSGVISNTSSSGLIGIDTSAGTGNNWALGNNIVAGSTTNDFMAFSPGSGNSLTLNGVVSGAGWLKVSSGGDLYVNNVNNSYTGGTEVGTGRIIITDSRALGAGIINFGTSANSYLVASSTVNVTNGITIGSGSTSGYTANLDTGTNNMTLSSIVADKAGNANGGKINKLGTGTLTLSGSNTYSGGTTLNQGTLAISASNNLGSGGVTINSNAILRATATLTNKQDITVSAGNTGYVEAAAGTTNTLNGTLTKNGSVLVLGGGGTHVVNGSITGANANSDLYVSNSTTTINSTNSYNGPTFVVAGGTLNNGADNALPTDTTLTLGQAGETSPTINTYNLNGKSQTVTAVATAGSSIAVVTNSTGSGNLTLNSSSAKGISNLTMGGTGLTLTKSGANTVTLASGNSIGPGTIAIQQGTLLLGAANQIGDSTAITLSGGTLETAGFGDAVGKLTVSANSTIKGLNSTSGTAFTFSDIDLGNYSTSSGSTLTFLSTGGTYGLG